MAERSKAPESGLPYLVRKGVSSNLTVINTNGLCVLAG